MAERKRTERPQDEELLMVVFTPRGSLFQMFTQQPGGSVHMWDFTAPDCGCVHWTCSGVGYREDELYSEHGIGCFWLKDGLTPHKSTRGMIRIHRLPPDFNDLLAASHEGGHSNCRDGHSACAYASAR